MERRIRGDVDGHHVIAIAVEEFQRMRVAVRIPQRLVAAVN